MDKHYDEVLVTLVELVTVFVETAYADSGAEPSLSVRQRAQDELTDHIKLIGDGS